MNKRKFTMYDVHNLIIESLFTPGGTLTVKRAAKQVITTARITYGKEYKKYCSKNLLEYEK